MHPFQEKTHKTMPVADSSSKGTSGKQLDLGFGERFFDLAVSFLTLLLLAPVILGLCMFIKLVSRGPIIFKQIRIGQNGHRFTMYKFRTMHAESREKQHEEYAIRLIRENRPMAKLDSSGDSRMIPFGKFFRASGLDELPQIVNVIKGDMRIVGPRPCLPCEFEAFGDGESLDHNKGTLKYGLPGHVYSFEIYRN